MPLIVDTLTSEGNLTLQNGTIVVGGQSLTLPSTSDTIVTLAASQTLTNKTIDGGSNTLTNIAQSSVTGLTTALSGKEPTITAGTSSQYWRGDKTFQTLNQAAVAGLTSSDTPTFAQVSLADPTASTHAVTLNYFQNHASTGRNWKQYVRLASNGSLATNTYNNGTAGVGATLTATANGALTIDGVAVSTNDEVLIKDEATGANNGIYVVTQTGSAGTPYILTRRTDADEASELPASTVIVEAGTANADKTYLLSTNGPITVGTTSLTWIVVSNSTYTADGTTITLSGNTFSVTTGGITNTQVSATAAIAYSKLNLSNSIVNADISTSAAIAYSKLNLASSIVNADIASGAAIAYSKLNLSGSIVNTDISNSAAIAYSKLSLSNSIVNADISSSAAIAYSKLNLTGAIVNADISSSAAISYSKLSLAGSITNSDLANMSQATLKGRAAGGGTGSPQDLTASQVFTILGIGGARVFKSGTVAGTSFTGNPRTASVSFGTAFASTAYQIFVMSDTNRTWTFSSKATTGFTINSNSATAFNSGNVDWFAIDTGETIE